MSHPEPNSQNAEQPYSEEALKIMAKARRRAGFSVLIMLIGFMTIALVVVYRLSTMGSDIDTRYAAQSIALPAGATVISSQVADGIVTVTYATGEDTAIRLFDGESGELINEIAILAQ